MTKGKKTTHYRHRYNSDLTIYLQVLHNRTSLAECNPPVGKKKKNYIQHLLVTGIISP